MTVQYFYPTPVDQSATNWAVAQRIVGPFAPHAQLVPDMTVALESGHLLSGTNLTEVNAQSTPAISPPTSGFRIDRIVVDRNSGAVSVVTGTANSLTPPAIPIGKLPVARVSVQDNTTAITNDLIVDERALSDLTPDSPLVACRVNLSNVQPIPTATFTKLQLNTAEYNFGNGFDTTNHQFKPSVAGVYSIFAQVCIIAGVGVTVGSSIFKNGAAVATFFNNAAGNGSAFANTQTVTYLNGTTDYVDLRGYQTNGANANVYKEAHFTFFTAQRIG